MLEKLYEYRNVFEKELVKAQAQMAVVDFMIENEKSKISENADTEIVENENEVAEQTTDESY